MPAAQVEQLEMAKNWIMILTVQEQGWIAYLFGNMGFPVGKLQEACGGL
jgi:hypothetical protein